ncbi:MAG: hypothetical protein U0103_26100 [Candidatus Obscuribacterales bacterium]|nr:hypothetical protein [Cyanobacteria bacterium SZAS LIN-5]
MTENKTDLRIGQLLIEAQILRARDLNDAIKIAKITSLPIGRILIMSSYVGEREFKAAVQAQSLIRDSVLPFSAAIEALCLMARNEMTFEECLNEIGWARAKDATTNKLGEMLLDAQIITKEQMESAIRTSESTGLPLGRVLVSLGALTDETLATALNAQVMVRDGKIDRDQAIRGLNAAYSRRQDLEVALAESGFYRGPLKTSVRLGEMLVMAKLVSAVDIMNALEVGLMELKPLGKTLVDLKLISEATLDAALELQEMVSNKTLDELNAIATLRQYVDTGTPIIELLSQLDVPQDNFRTNVRLHDLLRVAGLLQHSDIELSDIPNTAEASSADAKASAGRLLKNGFIDQRTYFGGLRCYFLVATGWMNIQQAIIALNYLSNQKESSFDDVLFELNWTIKSRPRFASDKRRKGIVTSEGSLSRLKLDDI